MRWPEIIFGERNRVDDSAHLDESLPFTIVPGEMRQFPGRHSNNLTHACGGDKTLESASHHAARGRTAVPHFSPVSKRSLNDILARPSNPSAPIPGTHILDRFTAAGI